MERAEIERRLRTLFETLFGVEANSITTDSTPETVPGWDSLQHLNLVTGIEDEFGIVLDDEQVVQMISFGLIVEILSESLAVQ